MILLTVLSEQIEPKTRTYYELTDVQFNAIINHTFHYGTKDGYDPYVFVDSEGEYAEFEDMFCDDTPRRYTRIDGTLLPSHQERLDELANGEIDINDIHHRVFLNDLVRTGLLPKGDYLIIPVEPEEPTVNFILV